MTTNILNALCIDLDDLAYSFLEAGSRIKSPSYLAEKESLALLEYLNRYNVKATFFIPGMIVSKSIGLIKAISAEGHAIASHGKYHVPVYKYTPKEFLQDIRWIKMKLEDVTGREIDTYKAPIWSITSKCIWAYDMLLEAGYKIDHTAMPGIKKRLHIEPESMVPFYYKNRLLVIPPTVIKIAYKRFILPFFGGFYNAHYPLWFQKKIFNKLNRKNIPFNYYFHPFEHSPREMNLNLYKYNLKISAYALHNGKYRFLISELLKEFSFSTLKNAYKTFLRDQPD